VGTAPTASPGRGGSHVNSGSTGPHLPGSCIREDINNLRSDDLERETVQVQMDLRLERIRKRHARAIASENCYVEVRPPAGGNRPMPTSRHSESMQAPPARTPLTTSCVQPMFQPCKQMARTWRLL
jgi:hypothetical protein